MIKQAKVFSGSIFAQHIMKIRRNVTIKLIIPQRAHMRPAIALNKFIKGIVENVHLLACCRIDRARTCHYEILKLSSISLNIVCFNPGHSFFKTL